MSVSDRELTIERKGYFEAYPAFTTDEFNFIKRSIDEQYLSVIKKENIPLAILEKHLKREFKINYYHEVSDYIDHSKTWPKLKRILPIDFVNWFLNTSYISTLESQFGEIEITDEELIGYPNIYWRITRPNKPRDIGALHRDSWFWEIDKLDGKNFPGYKRLKTWISINVEKGKNGLLVVKNSHKNTDLEWGTSKKDGKTKPFLKTKISENLISLLKTDNNTVVTFDDDLIHGGSNNYGKTTRVSMEFTVFLK